MKTSYPAMDTATQAEIDRAMEEDYGATPSGVTDEQWLDVGNGVWIRSYCTRNPNPAHKPRLWLVHYVIDTGTTLVYRCVDRIQQ